MNIVRVLSIATMGWRTAVPPKERLELLDQVDAWSKEQRELALAQQRGGDHTPVDFCPGFGPSVHRARGPVR
jgi:hypothetical protein